MLHRSLWWGKHPKFSWCFEVIMWKTGGLELKGEQLHVNDPSFPLVGPDLWKVGNQWMTEEDSAERRNRYQKAMRKQADSSASTFQSNRKQHIKGTMYAEVEKNNTFFIPEVDMTKSCVHEVEVTLLDEKGNPTGEVSLIEFAYLPLAQTEAKRILTENAITLCPSASNDIRDAPEGHMTASGARVCDGDIIEYKHTYPHQAKLSDVMGRYFGKHGFGHRVTALRKCLVDAGARSQSPTFGKFPWFTLTACTTNYGNENHVDPKDGGAQGMTVWHEWKPRKDKVKVSNWYFLFPDIRVFVDGTSRNGLAIPLCHGAVISWDGRCLRHCTAKPNIQGKNSKVFGTYFGAHQQVLEVAKKYPRCRRDADRPLTETEYREAKRVRTM